MIDASGRSLAYFYVRENDHDASIAKCADHGRGRAHGEQLAKLPELLTLGFAGSAVHTSSRRVASVLTRQRFADWLEDTGRSRQHAQTSNCFMAAVFADGFFGTNRWDRTDADPQSDLGGNSASCLPIGSSLAAFRCTGKYCDNIEITCTKLPGAMVGATTVGRLGFLRKVRHRRGAVRVQTLIAGLACGGRYCGHSSLYCVPLVNLRM